MAGKYVLECLRRFYFILDPDAFLYTSRTQSFVQTIKQWLHTSLVFMAWRVWSIDWTTGQSEDKYRTTHIAKSTVNLS